MITSAAWVLIVGMAAAGAAISEPETGSAESAPQTDRASAVSTTAIDEAMELAARPPVECEVLESPVRSTWRGTLWTVGVVPYEFSSNTTPAMQAAMCESMDELHQTCGVRFVRRTSQANFIFIQNSTGNNSFVGMIGGSQTVNIFNWNFRYIMMHELMHALGETHEQSRPDRAAFVQINSANICQDCCSGNPCNGNFNISASATVEGAYDFESIMHYGATAFSVNGQPTIQCIAPYTQFQTVIGNRNYLSALDKAGLIARYGPSVDDSFEPNDTLGSGLVLPGSTANLWLTDRDDYFRVTVPAGSATVSVRAWPEAPTESAQLSLYNLSSSLLGSQPFAAGPGAAESSATLTRTLAAGQDLVRISRSCGQGGAYTLTLPSRCPADVNGSGAVTVQDIFDYLELYFAGTLPAGDFNGSGTIGAQDVFDFLAAYFTPC